MIGYSRGVVVRVLLARDGLDRDLSRVVCVENGAVSNPVKRTVFVSPGLMTSITCSFGMRGS